MQDDSSESLEELIISNMATFHEHEIAKEIRPEIFTLKQPHLNSRNRAQNAAPTKSLSARRPGTSTFG